MLRILVTDQARGVWGAQRYLLRLAPLLLEHDIELTLASPRALEVHQVWMDAGLPAIHVELPVDRSIRIDGRPGFVAVAREGRRSASAVTAIAAAVNSGGYDGIWANGHWTHLDTAAAGRLTRRPTVLHLHEEAIPGVGTWMRAVAVRMADRCVAVSRAVAAGLPAAVQRRATVIANGVDIQPVSQEESDRVRAELGIRTGDILLVAATRLDPSKRIEDLITLMAHVGDPRLRLVIAGSTSGFPEYERRVRAQAATLAPDAVTFVGHRDDVAALLSAGDLVVHTGTVEGMPLSLLEAQSCATPVVAYDVAGVAEAMNDHVTGRLVPAGDTTALTDTVQALAADAALRARMGTAAREHVRNHHRIDIQAQRNARLLHAMCGLR